MDKKICKVTPDYREIYLDIINKKYPDKKEEYLFIISKQRLSAMEIIELNQKIFRVDKESEKFNQKHRSYKESDIFKILSYQKKYNLNNTQLANHFKLSRNTVAKWKKYFSVI